MEVCPVAVIPYVRRPLAAAWLPFGFACLFSGLLQICHTALEFNGAHHPLGFPQLSVIQSGFAAPVLQFAQPPRGLSRKIG